MKQKTAIRQFIEWLKTNEGEITELDVLDKAISLEPVNEQQIKDGYVAGGKNLMTTITNQQYFNEIFEKP